MTDNPTPREPVQDNHLTDSQLMEQRIEAALNPPEEPVEQEPEEELPAEPESEEEPEGDEPEEEAEDESEETEEAEEEPEPEGTSEFESLEDIAEALNITPDEFLERYKIKAKVDGEEIETSLSELKDGYQRLTDYRNKTAEVAEERKALKQEAETQKAEIENRLGQVSTLIDNLQSQVLSDFQGVNWEEVRANNPGEYAALLQDFQSRQSQLNQAQEAAKQESERLQQEQAAKQQEQYQELVQTERELLLDAIPEWKSKDVMTAEAKQMSDYLKSRGFNDQEINGAVDHRIIKMAYDLMKTDKVKAKADVVKNKVKTLPKLVKPGSKGTQKTAKQDAANKLRAKIKKTGGKTDDIAELLMNRF
jgi:hypothetical protein